MKNKKLLGVIIVFMTLSTTNLIAQNNFRNSNWGTDRATVKSKEKCKLIKEDFSKMEYDCSLWNIKGKVMYTFTSSDKLMRTKYLLTPDYINGNFYIQDYKMLQELLVEKYGKATSSNVIAVNGKTISKDEIVANLMIRNLRMETKWTTKESDILLTLSKVGDKPKIQIDYISNIFNADDIKERKERLLKDL